MSTKLSFLLFSFNVWAIGPQIGFDYLYIVHVAGQIECPEQLENDSQHPWFYLSPEKEWKKDPTVNITCSQ